MTDITDEQNAADRRELARWSGEAQQQLLDAAMRDLPAGCTTRELVHAAAGLARRVADARRVPRAAPA